MMNDEQQQINQEFENFHKAAANAIAACEAFIAMDINAPQEPVEAIFMGYKAELVQAKASIRATQARANKAKQDAESFRDMMPTSQEFYGCE